MIDQKKNKKFRMGSLLLKLHVKRYGNIKTQDKDQPTNNHKKNRKIKAIGNITPTMDYCL